MVWESPGGTHSIKARHHHLNPREPQQPLLGPLQEDPSPLCNSEGGMDLSENVMKVKNSFPTPLPVDTEHARTSHRIISEEEDSGM